MDSTVIITIISAVSLFVMIQMWVCVQGTNVDLLQEAIVTQAEVMELKGDPQGLVEGRIIEAKVDPRRGCVLSSFCYFC